MTEPRDRLTPEEDALVRDLSRLPAVAPSSALRERLFGVEWHGRIRGPGTPGRIAAALLVLTLAVTWIVPPRRSSVPPEIRLTGAALDRRAPAEGLRRFVEHIERVERSLR